MKAQITRLAGLLAILGALSGLGAGTALAGSLPVPGVARTTTSGSATHAAPAVSVPAPGPAVKGSVRLYLPDAFLLHHGAVTVPKRKLTLQGVVKPYVAGQYVRIRVRLGRRLFRSARLLVKPSASKTYGVFTLRFSARRAGIEHIFAEHGRTAQLLGFATKRRVQVLSPHANFGSTGRFVQLMQQQLAAVHIFLPQSGVYDGHMGLAVDAYHRLLGWGTSQNLGGATISALLDGKGTFHVRDPKAGKHVEGNLSKQLLALIYGSRVYRIYPISSGKPSTPTVLGHFKVYERTPGYLPDGMYYSDFFYRGYAIHGYDPAPDYPASHGCMRLPIIDAIGVFNWLSIGNVVDVYN